MRLENLYINFGKSPPEEQLKYIAEYRLRRAQDLAAIPSTPRKQPSDKRSKIDFSDEEKAVMKALGLKQKDLLLLKNSSTDAAVSSDDKDLFKDDSYELEE